MKNTLFIFLLLLPGFATLAQDTLQHIIPGRKNSLEQQKKPYVIMISVDALRYDYAEKFGAKNLLALSGQGIKAKAMIPSFPSLTFPNHYTLVTGMYPAHNGLVSNTIFDPAKREF